MQTDSPRARPRLTWWACQESHSPSLRDAVEPENPHIWVRNIAPDVVHNNVKGDRDDGEGRRAGLNQLVKVELEITNTTAAGKGVEHNAINAKLARYRPVLRRLQVIDHLLPGSQWASAIC